MIEIAEVHALQETYVNSIVEKDRAERMTKLSQANDTRKEKLIKAEEARKTAEEALPEVLEHMEGQIRKAVQEGKDSIAYSIPETMSGMYMVVMLASILPMHGYFWIIRDNQLKVSW